MSMYITGRSTQRGDSSRGKIVSAIPVAKKEKKIPDEAREKNVEGSEK